VDFMSEAKRPERSNRLILLLAPLGIALVAVLLLIKGFSAPLPTPVPSTPTPNPAQQVVARVGDRRLTFADWAVAYTLDATMSRLSGQPIPAPQETLDRWVNDVLILSAAEEEGVGVSQADVEARMAQLEAAWDMSSDRVTAELAAYGLSRQDWARTLARLLTVERYLNQVIWADVPPEGREAALGEWLQTRRAQVAVKVDTQDLWPALPTPKPIVTATPPPAPTATPVVRSPVASAPASGSSLVGQPAPDFSTTDARGEAVTLSDYRDHKVVVLVFFRTSG
jgi:hypothetical protein